MKHLTSLRLFTLSFYFFFISIFNSASGSIIAVVDSGNDFLHKDLVAHTWNNDKEIENNDRDDDKNGYPDDIHGWNFAENNNQLIDMSYSYTHTPDVDRFFLVQYRSILGLATEADKTWFKEKVQDQEFISNLSKFGNWMHGTHVTGIAVKDNPNALALGLKIIPTEVKLPGSKSAITIRSGSFSQEIQLELPQGLKNNIISKLLATLAKTQARSFIEFGRYIKSSKADVMNGSFGTSYKPIEQLISQIVEKVTRKKPTEAELKEYTLHFFEAHLAQASTMLSSSPNTLFVLAAGNDASNNDIFPISPGNAIGNNKITVAATIEKQALAPFSNFGAKNVDIAAPGVGIYSASPGDKYLHVSGTSQATPFVANVAALIKDTNQALKPDQIRKILMSTGDEKSWLKGKVGCFCIVNKERAVKAAELSLSRNLERAILESFNFVKYEENLDHGFFNPQVDLKTLMIKPISLPTMIHISK